MTTSLLLEIGTEELPAIPFLAELPHIKNKFQKGLESHRLECQFDFFYTPRRLVIIADCFPTQQSPKEQEFFGPPLSLAYQTKDGKKEPTQAALSFFKKCQIQENEVSTIKKGDKEVLYCKKLAPSLPAKDLIPILTQEFLESLNFGKTMRWGETKESFIRPIRWILALLGEECLNFSLYGVQSQNHTFVHRNITFEPLTIHSLQSYLSTLEQNKVLLNPAQRKEKILSEITQIEQTHHIKVELDKELLEEIIAITEYPTALLGEFSEHFLELPPPCIITSMKVNQRYFATYKDSKLYNGFIVVSNSLSEDFSLIIEGNIKVLRARLEDALFFYHNDLKRGFEPQKLENITFVEGLGSMWDKIQRESKITQILAQNLKSQIQSEEADFTHAQELINQSVLLSKADLLTEMVYEFTELQGIMGYYYAQVLGYDPRLCLALKEQYLPNAEESQLPSTIFSAIIALSYKLDNLLGLFSLNKIPSGSRDPFALRRAANGVIKILLHFKLPLNLNTLLHALAPLYQSFDINLLENFILERLEGILPFNASLLRSVLLSGERDLNQISLKLTALDNALKGQDKTLLTQTFKRLANIIKEVDLQASLPIKEEKLVATEEIELFNAFRAYQNQAKSLNYEEQLRCLLNLNGILARFFDKVLVNAPDEDFKNNRKHLIAQIYLAFLKIADIKAISF